MKRYTGPLIGCAEVADMLGLKERAIRLRRSVGKLPKPAVPQPPYKWREREIEAWIDAGMPKEDEWERKKKQMTSRKTQAIHA